MHLKKVLSFIKLNCYHFDRPVNLTGTRQPKSLANFKPAPHFSHNIDLSMGVMLKDRNDE
jgi:hypothetical protein